MGAHPRARSELWPLPSGEGGGLYGGLEAGKGCSQSRGGGCRWAAANLEDSRVREAGTPGVQAELENKVLREAVARTRVQAGSGPLKGTECK